MAFVNAQLQAVNGGHGGKQGAPTIWSYGHTDSLATVVAAGYFNDAHDVLTPGDLIFVSVRNEAVTAGQAAQMYQVTAISDAGVVTIVAR